MKEAYLGIDVGSISTKGVIINKTLNKEYAFEPMPDFIRSIMEAGGLIECIKEGRI